MLTNRKIGVLITGLLILGLFFQSCEKVTLEKVVVVGDKKFSADILPILEQCTSCHGGSRKPDLRPDKAYNSLTTGGYYNLVTPEQSKIYTKLSSGHKSGITDANLQTILLWIQQGAKND